MDSHSCLLRHKAVRDACQAELSKQTRYLEKWQTVNEKNICQEEHTMRQQLERLQQDKARFSLEAEAKEQHKGKRRFSESDSHNEQIRRHSFSSHLPKISDKRSFHSNEVLLQQPRSHRQLRMDSATKAPASQNSIRGGPKETVGQVTKLPSIQKDEDRHQSRDRRKSMPAAHVYANKERRQHGDKRKKKHHSVPSIVVTDFTSSSPEQHVLFSHEDQHETVSSKHAPEKNHQPIDRRLSQHSQGRHDARGSHQSLDHMNDTEELTSLYDMAIQTVASANEFAFTQVQDVHKRVVMPNWKDETKFPDAKQMDLSSLQELEQMLKDARQYNVRKQKETDYGLHTAENRQQRRRLQFLEEILQALSDNHGPAFDPMEMLQCGYLRLSKSNIERLEYMVREAGIDPGIHAHSDVTHHDIWHELRELRQKEALEREQLQKEESGRRSKQSIRRGRSDVKQTA